MGAVARPVPAVTYVEPLLTSHPPTTLSFGTGLDARPIDAPPEVKSFPPTSRVLRIFEAALVMQKSPLAKIGMR